MGSQDLTRLSFNSKLEMDGGSGVQLSEEKLDIRSFIRPHTYTFSITNNRNKVEAFWFQIVNVFCP